MKKYSFLILTILCLFSCSDSDDNTPDNQQELNHSTSGNVYKNDLLPGQALFNYQSDQEGNTLSFSLKGNGEVSIDWGDGSAGETVQLAGSRQIKHDFKPDIDYPITISGLDNAYVEEMQLNHLSMTALLFGENHLLQKLSVYRAQSLEQADLTKCTALSDLSLGDTKKLPYLNLNANTKLGKLFVRGNVDSLVISGLNQLKTAYLEINRLDIPSLKDIAFDELILLLDKNTEADFSGTKARSIALAGGRALKSLTIDSAPNLTQLAVDSHPVASGDYSISNAVLNNLPELESLTMQFDGLPSLPLAGFKKLQYVYLSYKSYLKEITLPESLQTIHMTCLSDAEGYPDDLQSIDFSGCKNLHAILSDNQRHLQNMNIAGLESLQHVSIHYADIREIDLTRNKGMAQLALRYSNTEHLTIDGLSALKYVNLRGNKLADFTCPGLANVSFIDIRNNQLSADAVEALFNSLEQTPNPDSEYKRSLYFQNNPGYTPSVVDSINQSPYWEAGKMDDNINSY